MDSIRAKERIQNAERNFGYPSLRLEELSKAINLGRPGDQFKFVPINNAIYIPLIGMSDVLDSTDDITLKAQNYAQVVIDPALSHSQFVSRFLNSEFGKELREINKSGFIPKLSKQTLKNIPVVVPDLNMQKNILEIEARIMAEKNVLSSLQNELGEIRQELWSKPTKLENIDQRLLALSHRLSGNLKQYAAVGLSQWFETLPFPLASILRAWQATSSDDYKTKYEHLLHFFEATAEFLSIIMLSAFYTSESLFEPYKQDLVASMQKNNLSFQRATFGTWKVVVEYLGKKTRELLLTDGVTSDELKNKRALCADMFSDMSFVLPEALSRKELAGIISRTNKMRNDWSGHGGIVGQDDAQIYNEQLLGEVQKLREVMADTWSKVQLIRALLCRPKHGIFENEVAVLTGSNSEFLPDTIPLSTWLDVENLYLLTRGSTKALKLLPLIQIGPSPKSAKNACYFFSRLEREGASFVSYHFVDKPQLTERFDEAIATIKFITGT